MKRISGLQAAGLFLALPIGISLLMGAAKKPAPAKQAPPAKKPAPAAKPAAGQPQQKAPAGNLSGTAGKPQPTGKQTAGEVYKNILVLKDLPADQMLTVMQEYSQALGVQCTFCHVEDFAADVPHKKITRNMILLTQQINKNPSVQNRVTCFTCHQGDVRTVNSPGEAEKRAAQQKAGAKTNTGEPE